MSARKRRRIESVGDFLIDRISSEEDEDDESMDLDQDDPELIAKSRARRQKNSKIRSTSEEVNQATNDNKDFSISPELTSLILKDLNISGSHAARNLGVALSASTTNLTQIEIQNCSTDVTRTILKSIKNSNTLTELVIKYDEQHESGGELQDLPALLPRLQTLWLENYVLSPDTVRLIFGKVLNQAPLKKLGIINAKLTQAECATIMHCFPYIGNYWSTKLTQLNLSHNPIKNSKAVSAMVAQTYVEELDLTNCQIDDEGLLPLLSQCRNVKHLKLGRNSIGQAGLKNLIQRINESTCLITLDLRGIDFSPSCIEMLAKKMKSKTLQIVQLDVDIPSIAEMTTKNTLMEGFDHLAFTNAINNDNWNVAWNIIKDKPNVPLRYMIPLDRVTVTKAHQLHTSAVESLKKHISTLGEEHKSELGKKENEKERIESLNKKKLELENELKKVTDELNGLNLQAREERIKAREKNIEVYSNCLELTEESMQFIEGEVEAWKELAKKNIADWSKVEVRMFMRNIGLSSCERILKQNKITGSVLVHLSTADYRQLGFTYPQTMQITKALFVAKHFKSTEAPPGVLRWTVQDVKDWLTRNNFQSLSETFVNNQITGGDLLFLQTPDLKEWLKIEPLADRIKLEQAIITLKNSFFEDIQQPVKQKPKVPSHFKCPITTEIMKDPVITSDGHTYERFAIEQWLLNHNTSPMTNEELANKQLHPCHYLKNMISEFLEQQH